MLNRHFGNPLTFVAGFIRTVSGFLSNISGTFIKFVFNLHGYGEGSLTLFSALPLARDANIPTKHRAAKMANAIFVPSKKLE